MQGGYALHWLYWGPIVRIVKFSVQLSAYYPDHETGGRQLYRNMLDQAALADRLGYDAVSITEHHLINILLMPAPLQFAVKIASLTEKVKILTSVADRYFDGVVQGASSTQCFCEALTRSRMTASR